MARRKHRSTFGSVIRRKKRGEYLPGFYVRVRLHGREVTRWAGPDRETAHRFLADLCRKSAAEDLLGEKAVQAVTMDRLKGPLVTHLEARHTPQTVATEKARLEEASAYFGTRPLRDLSASDVSDFLTALAARGAGPATCNRYLALLSVAFRFAAERGWARDNPAKAVPRQREAVRAIPYISREDVDRIVATAGDPDFAAFLRVASETGLRRGEMLRLEWRDVDLRRNVLVVRLSKAKRPRELPLTEAAKAVLAEMRDRRGAVPMTGPDRIWSALAEAPAASLSARFGRVARRAGFTGLRLHDLRHSFASRCAQAGVPIPVVGVLLGHADLRMTQRYACHLPEGATAAAIARLQGVAGGADSGTKGDARGDATNPTDAKAASASA